MKLIIFMLMTTSPSWFRVSRNEFTMPRSGLELDRRVSSTVTRTVSRSPGRTGLFQRSSSTPGEPRLATAER